MKKILTILIGLSYLLLVSCEETKPIEEDTPLEHETELLIHNIPEGDLEILFIDRCEYIVYKDGKGSNHGFGYLAHKGNCKNPIHCHNQISKKDSTTRVNRIENK